MREARDQARIEVARETLVRILLRRFPPVLTEGVPSAINGQPSLDLLRAWLYLALAAFSGDEFLAALRR